VQKLQPTHAAAGVVSVYVPPIQPVVAATAGVKVGIVAAQGVPVLRSVAQKNPVNGTVHFAVMANGVEAVAPAVQTHVPQPVAAVRATIASAELPVLVTTARFTVAAPGAKHYGTTIGAVAAVLTVASTPIRPYPEAHAVHVKKLAGAVPTSEAVHAAQLAVPIFVVPVIAEHETQAPPANTYVEAHVRIVAAVADVAVHVAAFVPQATQTPVVAHKP